MSGGDARSGRGHRALPPAMPWALLDAATEGMFAFDSDLRYLYWNAAMEAIFGLRASEVVGQRAPDLFPFLVETGQEPLLRRALAGGEASVTEHAFAIAATGRGGWLEARYLPLRDETGTVIGGMGIVRDITDQRRSQQQMHETEARFRNMADVAPVLLWMAGTDGLCTFFNQTWLTFTGRTLEQEWGVGWAEGVYFEDFQACMDGYTEAFNARRTFEMEYRLRRADGEYRWVLDRGTPRYHPDGTFAGYIGSCADITDRKRLERDLRGAVHMRDEFLSIASHELKTPLTSLQLQFDLVGRQLRKFADDYRQRDEAERLREAVDRTNANVERLGALVNELLDVSRLTSGRFELHIETVDLAALASEVVDRWRMTAASAQAELSLHAPDSLTGQWDRLRLEQVLNNLLENAVKYGPGKPIDVEVAAVDDDRAGIVVRDRGIGIAPEDQARIFQRFERAVPSRNYGGLGLGLWISRRFVVAMEGTIGVTSTPGEGATFIVELPRRSPRRVDTLGTAGPGPNVKTSASASGGVSRPSGR